MNNLNQNKAIYYRNQLVSFLYFDTVFYSFTPDNKIEERMMITIGTSVLNVATLELYN